MELQVFSSKKHCIYGIRKDGTKFCQEEAIILTYGVYFIMNITYPIKTKRYLGLEIFSKNLGSFAFPKANRGRKLNQLISKLKILVF